MLKWKNKSMVIFFGLVFLTANNRCYAAEDGIAYTRQGIIAEYESDAEFLRMKENYGEEYAEEFLDKVYEQRVQSLIVPYGGGGNECYDYVKNIKQTKNYNCGTTTVLQTLYGLDSADKVAGSTDQEKIATLDVKYNVDQQTFTYVYQVVDALNTYYSTSDYVYTAGSSLSEAEFENTIANSLMCGRPVILHAKTECLAYYEEHESGHYLSLDYVNRTTDMVRIVDCNNNDKYFGIRMVPLEEAYKSVHDTSGRYLIH